ncbi:MAG: alpha/beta hydrolase [Bryobacteraceae bacterium]
MPRRVQSLLLEGPAGKLEARLDLPDEPPGEAALVCHPHPLYGGTMHNKVVHRLARGLARSGSVVLRFNFRGVGRSEGKHAHGAGELEDARAALSWLRAQHPGLPFALAGFSFGSRVVSQLGCELDRRPSRVVLAGFPTRMGDLSYLERCAAPKYFLQSTHDHFGPRDELETLFERFAEPKKLIWVEADDHFFAGSLEVLEHLVLTLPR